MEAAAFWLIVCMLLVGMTFVGLAGWYAIRAHAARHPLSGAGRSSLTQDDWGRILRNEEQRRADNRGERRKPTYDEFVRQHRELDAWCPEGYACLTGPQNGECCIAWFRREEDLKRDRHRT